MSFASHLFLFAVLFLALVAISFLSIKSRGGAKTEFLLCHIIGGVVLAFVIRKVVMPAIAFNGPLAFVYSCAASCLITTIAMCLRLKLQQNSRGPINDGNALSLKSFTLPAISSNGGKALCVVVVALVGWIIPANVAMRDWDFLFQKLSVMVMWPLCFAVCFELAARAGNQRRFRTLCSSLLIAGAGAYLLIVTNWLKIPGPYNGGNNSAIIESYAGCDLSLRAIRELFSSSTDDREFYEYLRSYTNILPSTRVSPAEVNLVEHLKATNADRPNIFLIVVDSLRRDYLSPYNRNVGFTPNIEQLAQDGIVMKNALPAMEARRSLSRRSGLDPCCYTSNTCCRSIR